MSEELGVRPADDLATRPREEIEEAARKWFNVATDLKSVQDELVKDLEDALNLVRRYQHEFVQLGIPDPGLVTARLLLTKYKMTYTEPKGPGQVFADGVDITEHPDSIPGSAAELALPEPDRFELIQTEDGKVHFRPVYDELEPEQLELLKGEVTDE